ncbi:hypothetical protein L9F63_011558, partial [Diploptera punctata]
LFFRFNNNETGLTGSLLLIVAVDPVLHICYTAQQIQCLLLEGKSILTRFDPQMSLNAHFRWSSTVSFVIIFDSRCIVFKSLYIYGIGILSYAFGCPNVPNCWRILSILSYAFGFKVVLMFLI